MAINLCPTKQIGQTKMDLPETKYLCVYDYGPDRNGKEEGAEHNQHAIRFTTFDVMQLVENMHSGWSMRIFLWVGENITDITEDFIKQPLVVTKFNHRTGDVEMVEAAE